MTKIKTAIVGATGFTGSELARLIALHPSMDLVAITSESSAGEKFSSIHPQFFGLVDQILIRADEIEEKNIDLVFLAVPHGVSMHYIELWKNADFKIVDLSGDYRLNDPETYESWYGKKHSFTEAFDYAVYGLPEFFSKEISKARLVANPGCYPTSSILGVYPLIKENLVDANRIVIDSKSGATGAGIKAKSGTLYSQINENFNAYAIGNHRHTVEIEQILTGKTKSATKVQFTPHLLPVDRGILSTIYAQKTAEMELNTQRLHELYREVYADQPFIRIREEVPGIKEVRGTNFCDLYPTYDPRTNNIIVISTIDNLMKGAAGQAIHNANLMFGLKETAGLDLISLKP
nr:N-acetyl-gamma-glutamyl-phosphate reductase [Saprospiraceae bacterium]